MFGVIILLSIVYEIIAAIQNQGYTISEIVWSFNKHPVITFALGFLMGHFFWQAIRNGGMK